MSTLPDGLRAQGTRFAAEWLENLEAADGRFAALTSDQQASSSRKQHSEQHCARKTDMAAMAATLRGTPAQQPPLMRTVWDLYTSKEEQALGRTY